MKKPGDKITTVDLEESWEITLANFDLMIKNGVKIRPIRILIRYIIAKKYSTVFYAGSSMYSLLISKPNDMIIDFVKTLKVSIDQRTSAVEFRYQCVFPRPKNPEWIEACQFTEIIDTFEYFIQIQNPSFIK